MAFMNFTVTALKNLFSKPATTDYPLKEKEYPKGTRGAVEIDIDACIFCGMCAKKCPTGVIMVDRAEKKWTIEPYGCISCAACALSCPKKCLSLSTHYTAPGPEQSSRTFEKGE